MCKTVQAVLYYLVACYAKIISIELGHAVLDEDFMNFCQARCQISSHSSECIHSQAIHFVLEVADQFLAYHNYTDKLISSAGMTV